MGDDWISAFMNSWYLYACCEYKNTPDSLYSILVAFIRNCKYSWSVFNTMKMKTISECKAFLTLLTISLIVYFLVSSTALIVTDSQGKRDYSEKSTNEEPNDSSTVRSDEKKGSDAIGIKGDQLIYCEGDLNSCHNVLTNIICSNVKYCIVGDITPFVMSNPL